MPPCPEDPAPSTGGDFPGTGSMSLPASLLTAVFLLLIPVRIINLGFLPYDDALRHAAKVVSGKSWSDILVLRNGIMLDDHPGWHALLSFFHRLFGLDVQQLVLLSVALLFLLFVLTPLLFLERKESWAAALLILATAHIANFQRLLAGRPFLVTMTALAVILFIGPSLAKGRASPKEKIVLTLFVALAVWMHGSWYLFALPLAAFFLARKWRALPALSLCIIGGTVLGSSLTGHPVLYIRDNLLHAFHAFGSLPQQRMLVAEFQPFDGYPLIIVAGLLLMMWRRVRGGKGESFLSDPAFILAAGCYLLGYLSSRFWYDWGVPAFLVWTAREMDEVFRETTGRTSWCRVPLAAAVALSLVLTTTNDYRSRYSSSLTTERLSLRSPDQAVWLPEPGGILYSNHMGVFYQTFYENPQAPWKYVLGFEPTMMPEEDLEVYRKVFLTNGSPSSFDSWVGRMGKKDRLVLKHHANWAPAIPELDWHQATGELWIGALP